MTDASRTWEERLLPSWWPFSLIMTAIMIGSISLIVLGFVFLGPVYWIELGYSALGVFLFIFLSLVMS
jgi:hypothetical protein